MSTAYSSLKSSDGTPQRVNLLVTRSSVSAEFDRGGERDGVSQRACGVLSAGEPRGRTTVAGHAEEDVAGRTTLCSRRWSASWRS
ncbi:hypothetical protein ACWEFJ_24205, partial [Actinosynnema sp. NPDC004786]